MRCIKCSAEMQLASVMPEPNRLVAGFERHLLRCPGCGRLASKSVFAREIGPIAVEPMQLPKGSRSPLIKGASARALPALQAIWLAVVGIAMAGRVRLVPAVRRSRGTKAGDA
jgi:hypothetical protein